MRFRLVFRGLASLSMCRGHGMHLRTSTYRARIGLAPFLQGHVSSASADTQAYKWTKRAANYGGDYAGN